jgi:integrase
VSDSGLRDARLHDARHTAATVLLILGVPTPTAMALMGWSSPAMAKRYQHLIDTIRRDVAKQVGGLLWDADGASSERAARANETRNETRQEAGPER